MCRTCALITTLIALTILSTSCPLLDHYYYYHYYCYYYYYYYYDLGGLLAAEGAEAEVLALARGGVLEARCYYLS